MATTRSELQGFAELDRVLQALPGRLAERELTSAVRAGATWIGFLRSMVAQAGAAPVHVHELGSARPLELKAAQATDPRAVVSH